jgi:hypothetical protein
MYIIFDEKIGKYVCTCKDGYGGYLYRSYVGGALRFGEIIDGRNISIVFQIVSKHR